MGEARRRGTFEERRAQAIAAGRVKQGEKIKRPDMLNICVSGEPIKPVIIGVDLDDEAALTSITEALKMRHAGVIVVDPDKP